MRGVQTFAVGATVKHYVANDSETDRFSVDVQVDERTLREVYLRAFEEPVIDGGAWLVMSAYNSINGVTASENSLLTTPLNSEWGFDGVVVSDWTAVQFTRGARYSQDLVMPGPGGPWGDDLVAAVEAGRILVGAIDRKVDPDAAPRGAGGCAVRNRIGAPPPDFRGARGPRGRAGSRRRRVGPAPE